MLGLGTRLFISSEESYGTVKANDVDFGSGTYTTDPNQEYHTYYIQNDRVTTSFNQDEVSFINSDRGRRNIFHKNVNNMEGSFTFNLQHNMLKLLSFFTNYKPTVTTNTIGSMDRQNLNYSGENTLNFSHYEITTVPTSTDVTLFDQDPLRYNLASGTVTTDVGDPYLVKSKLVNHPIIPLQLRHKTGLLSTDPKAHYLYGCCMNSLNLNISQDSSVILTIDFLGQREEPITWQPSVNKVEDVYADIYPSWKAKLELYLDSYYQWVEYPFKDFSLEINNNLEFAPFMETTNQYPSKAPFPGLRETTGSFTIEYSDDTDYNNKSFYDYITEIKDDIKLRLSLEDGTSKFIINCDNIVFTDGGSLDSLPEGMLELNLAFTAVNKATKIRDTNETENYNNESPTETKSILPVTEEISFTIRE